MNLIRLFRDANPDGGGGDGFGTPLEKLMAQQHNQQQQAANEGLEDDGVTLKAGYLRDSGTGTISKDPNYVTPAANPMIDPEKERLAREKAAQQTSDTEGINADGTLKEGYRIIAGTNKVEKDPDYKEPVETGLNEDGTLKPGFIKDATGNVIADPNYVDPDLEDKDGSKFIAAVENIHGYKYEVEYPNGIVPASPEGAAIREKFIREQSMLQFEEHLKASNPRGYAFLLHLEAGGKEEDFFGEHKGYQLPILTELQSSADLQANTYKQDLLIMGLDADAAQALVDKAIKDNTLKAKAEASYTKLDKAQKDQLKSLEDSQKEKEQKLTTDVATLNTALNKVIKEDMSFVVPEAKIPEFRKFVLDNLRYDDGKFYVTQEMAANDMKTMMESLFFQYMKGDLSTIVAKKVQTKAAQNLRRNLSATVIKPAGGGGAANSNNVNVPLSQLL